MSINWVMLDSKGFVPLPREKTLFTSPPRTSLTLQTPNSYPGKEPLAIKCSEGTAYLTNQRLVYIPSASSNSLQSFSSPILNLQDTHVSTPFFGPNTWIGLLRPVTGGGIPPHHAFVQIKMSFKEGGAYDFQTKFEIIKETLSQAIEEARASGRVAGHAAQPQAIDLSAVHLDQLPAYEEIGNTVPAPEPRPDEAVSNIPPITQQPAIQTDGTASNSTGFQPPSEPPPGYEEAQRSGVANSLEESVRRTSQ